jgi:protease-4
VVALVAIAMLGLSMLGSASRMLRGWLSPGHRQLGAGPHLEEVVVEDSAAEAKIAVIPVEGLIYGASLDGSGASLPEMVRHQLKRAGKDPDVKAVLLRVETPGGEVLASDDISRAVVEFQEQYRKPVVASMGSVAASGGYYVSAPCRWIVAHELTITGSIGVIIHGYNYRGLMDKVGLRPEVYKSGRFKDMLSGDRLPSEIDPEERRMLKELIDQAFGRFKKVVGEGRRRAAEQNQAKGRALAANWQDYADGRVLTGQQAYDCGFVDELGDFKVAAKTARRLAGIETAKLVEYRRPFDLASFLHLFGKAEPPTLKIDWGMDLPRVQAGRLYYLFEVGAP